MKNKIATVLILGTIGTGGTVAVDRSINPYDDKTTHYELSVKSDIPQNERVIINKDKAEMTLKGWNDEFAIKVIPQIPSSTTRFGSTRADFNTQARRPLLSRKIEYRQGDVTAFIEPREAENEFDIDFTLDSKPDTNIFTYVIEGAEEFDFWYQPELTQEEIDEGVSRPDNVIGSYAVYHKTKANHKIGSTNYATGKVFHIYRPKAIDALGVEEWAILNYNNGVLSVTVSQDFLDKATYPVVVDPTFGYTSIGGTQTTDGGTTLYGKVTATGGGTLTAITIYCNWNNAGSSTIGSAWYSDSAGDPNTKIYTTTGQAVCESGTPGWRSGTLTGTFTGSTDYWIGMYNGAGSIRYYYDATGTSDTNTGFANLPATATPANTNTNRNYSVYVTYTADTPTSSTTTVEIKGGVEIKGNIIIR